MCARARKAEHRPDAVGSGDGKAPRSCTPGALQSGAAVPVQGGVLARQERGVVGIADRRGPWPEALDRALRAVVVVQARS